MAGKGQITSARRREHPQPIFCTTIVRKKRGKMAGNPHFL